MSSLLLRKMKLTIMPPRPSTAIHQMCHTRAKPITIENMPMKKPAPVFFGMWIFS